MKLLQNKKIYDYSLAMLNLGLDILGVVFMHPVKTSKKKMFIFGGFFYLFTYLHYILVVKQFQHINGEIYMLSRSVASFSTYTQATLKMLPIIVFKNHIIDLIERRKYFWKTSEEQNPKLHKEVGFIYYAGYYFLKLFRAAVGVTAITYYLKPIFDKELFIILWVPNYPYAFEILLVGQYIYCPLLCCLIVGTDSLYVSLCLDTIAQFKILNEKLRNIMVDSVQSEGKMSDIGRLKECIKHHIFLLSYVTDIEKLFMFSLFGEYIITIGSTCMEMYTLTEDGASFNNKVISFMYCISLLLQFALFCFPASALSSIMLEVSDSLYFCNWEDASDEVKQCIPFAIMRSQKAYALKAGGMLEINLEAFTNVFKTAFSFLTLMRSL